MNALQTFKTITSKSIAVCAVSTAIFTLFYTHAAAQNVYKVVGSDGRVTFTDRLPMPDDKAKVSAARTGGFVEVTESMPRELVQIQSKFPVTLYSAPGCGPCDAARSLLKSRGVPHKERSVENEQDAIAYKKIVNDGTLPFLTVGGQQIRGHSDANLNETLDLAGYPKQSVLPKEYKFAAATPMTPRVEAPKPAASAPPPKPAAAAQAPAPAANNPAGIKF